MFRTIVKSHLTFHFTIWNLTEIRNNAHFQRIFDNQTFFRSLCVIQSWTILQFYIIFEKKEEKKQLIEKRNCHYFGEFLIKWKEMVRIKWFDLRRIFAKQCFFNFGWITGFRRHRCFIILDSFLMCTLQYVSCMLNTSFCNVPCPAIEFSLFIKC